MSATETTAPAGQPAAASPAQRQLAEIHRTVVAFRRPADRRIYKPTNAGTGACLKLNLRVDPEYRQSAAGFDYVDDVDGGLFLEIVPQAPGKSDAGFAKFDYDSDQRVAAKLGTPDVAGLLASYRAVRDGGREVPVWLRRGRTLDDKKAAPPNEFSAFHQTANGSNTGIAVTFLEEGSSIQLTKNDGRKQYIRLSAAEEEVFRDYIGMALRAFNTYGL